MWPFKRRKTYVSIAGERIEIKPLTLPMAIELIILMAPYWPILREYTPQIEKAKQDNDLLSVLLFLLRDKMQTTPGDITKMVGILMGVNPAWLASYATAEEIVKVLPVLDKVHELERLWLIVQQGADHLGVSD